MTVLDNKRHTIQFDSCFVVAYKLIHGMRMLSLSLMNLAPDRALQGALTECVQRHTIKRSITSGMDAETDV